MREELDEIYKEYGFSKQHPDNNICLYLFEEGRYFGAEIIPLSSERAVLEKCEEIRKEYADGGYAAIIRNVCSAVEASNELYKSFFSYEATLGRLKLKYKKFVKTQSETNGSGYKYVLSPFQLNNESPPSNNIIDEIIKNLGRDKAKLIIIEAAAGYGKTCTSYEILHALVDNDKCDNPIITELSRNRGANIFRYILLDEIDREYPTLDSRLVNYEIQSGRIPLIIDGFDELLHKSELVTESEEVFGEVEPMLDTIGKMLIGRAKIILTTRKTAIFGGNEFRDWLNKWGNQFEVCRYSIEVPRIKDWIGETRLNLVKQKNIPMEQLGNPVLLTYLRGLSDADFTNHMEEPDLIVKKYFYSLMEREKTRQELYINPEDQYAIFKNIVKLMIEFDVSSEKRQFMKDMIEDQNKEILEKALKAYPGNPTIETLTDKLVNHAILDRKGREENMIGFINEFIFGSFIGEIITEASPKDIENSFSAYMVELGATAYRVQNSENKELLWDKIESLKYKFPENVLFHFDITLKGQLTRNISDVEVQGIEAFNVLFDNQKIIKSSVFTNCKFKNCVFSVDSFESVSFIQCVFDSCRVEGGGYLDSKNDNSALGCTQLSGDVFYFGSTQYYENEYSEDLEFQDEILSALYELEEKGRGQKLLRLVNGFEKSKRKKVRIELEKLNHDRVVKISGNDVHIEINKIRTIKERLGIV